MRYTKEQLEKINLPILHLVGEEADKLGYKCYVIGGWVRDLLMNRPNDDIDIVVVGSGKEIAEAVSKRVDAKKVTIYENYGTAQIMTNDGLEVEFVGARKEFYHRESRNPIVENGTLQDDMARRDFTINDMAICLNEDEYGELIDPYDGKIDMREKRVRCVGDPEERFSEDPLRMLRAIRFSARFKYLIDPYTYKAIKTCADRIKIITKERVLDELNKIILTDNPSYGFMTLKQTGLLQYIFPALDELSGVEVRGKNNTKHKDIFLHTMQVLDNVSNVSDKLYLRWAALLHDIGKPKSKKWNEDGKSMEGKGQWTFFDHEGVGAKMIPNIFKKMGFPQDDRMTYVQKLVSLHMRPMTLCENGVTDSAVRRILFDAGEDIDDLMILCNADITSKNETKVATFHNNYEMLKQRMVELEESDRLRNFQPPIDGNEIMSMFNLVPCRLVGELKSAVKDAILDGVIKNDYEEAKELVTKLYFASRLEIREKNLK